MQSLDNIELLSAPSQPCESGGSSEILYYPQVNNDLIPKIGQQFGTLDEVHQFYNTYGKEAGFGTRHHSTKKSREGEIIRKEFVCCKQGVSVPKPSVQNSETTTRRRGTSREFCGAKLAVVKNRSGGGFVVTQFVEGHSHPLTTPKRVHLLRSDREVPLAKRALTQQLAEANVPMCQRMSLFEVQSGGLDKVGFLERDLRNAERDRRKVLLGQDANMLFEHFDIEQKKNPAFVFKFKEDAEGRMEDCFWVDATCRKSYEYFGDVVVFDTTYQTNRYNMIFAPFLGVNHHGQTTLLGCAFLTEEKAESFEWLLKEWLKVMPGGPPRMIITDQDRAMAKAIATVLPNTHHRFCIWHIVSKFSEKISALCYVKHYDEFKKCIWKSESVEEFEAGWVNVVQKAGLSNNDWLHGLFRIRERWVPIYMKHMFSAGMTSSQRAENSHAFFKRYVCSQNSLWDFVTRFNRALSHLRHNELELDHKDLNEKPLIKTMWGMELTMSEIYTRFIFYKFQEELFQNSAYVLTKTLEDEQCTKWDVKRDMENAPKGREVSVDKSSNHVSCNCKLFESEGIPCRHMLKYFVTMQIRKLPDEYILRRWTISSKAGRVRVDLGGGSTDICDTSMRRNKLLPLACNAVEEAISSEENSKILEEALLSAVQQFKKLEITNRGTEDGDGVGESCSIQQPMSLASQYNVKEPNVARSKGCGKRMKGGKEKAMKKARRCNGCGKLATHDKRNCPVLLAMRNSQDVRLDDDEGEDDEDDSNDMEDEC